MRASPFLLLSCAFVGGISWTAPAPVRAQVQDRIVTVFGDDPCPASNGQEIVICRRAPRNEQFRIPKDLRESEVAPQAVSSTALAAVQTTGGTATQVQSCSAVGAGVNAGCLKKQADAWHAQKQAEKAAAADIP